MDAASFGGGYGAGVSAGLSEARAEAQDDILRERSRAEALKNDVHQKWIPYANRLQASIFAGRTQKDDLIAALKAADPTNADRIVEEAKQHALAEYDRMKADPEALKMINEQTLREAEEGRLDR